MAGSQALHFPPGFLRWFFFIIWDHHLALPLHLGCCLTVFVLVSGCICDARKILQGGLERSGPDSHWGQVSQWSWAQHHLCCCCSVSKSCPTPWTAAHQASLSFTISWSLLKLMSIELVMPSNHLILGHPLLLPSIFPSIRVFSNESVLCIRWPKYWSFSFSISPSNERSWLVSFRTDWFDCFAVQGTLKSLLQHHYSKASIIWHSASLSPPYLPLYPPCLAAVTVSETSVTGDWSSGLSKHCPSFYVSLQDFGSARKGLSPLKLISLLPWFPL